MKKKNVTTPEVGERRTQYEEKRLASLEKGKTNIW